MMGNEMALMASIAVDMQDKAVKDVLDKIKAEIESLNCEYIDYDIGCSAYISQNDVLQILNKYTKGVN